MRSDSAEELKKLEASILPLMQQAADEENRRWGAKPEQQIKVELKLVGDRPAGAQTYESPVVDTARAALATLGLEAKEHRRFEHRFELADISGYPGRYARRRRSGVRLAFTRRVVSSGRRMAGAAEGAANRPRIGRRSGFERAVTAGACNALNLKRLKKSPRIKRGHDVYWSRIGAKPP